MGLTSWEEQVAGRIGKGAFGAVWQAVVTKTGQEVVLKVDLRQLHAAAATLHCGRYLLTHGTYTR
jgi:hypothetical protein